MFDTHAANIINNGTARQRRDLATTATGMVLGALAQDRVAFVRAAAARRVSSNRLAEMAKVETSPSVLEIIWGRGCDRHREILVDRGVLA